MKRITIFFFLLIVAMNSWAWGPKGHRIVAQVAYDNLDCKARKHVDKVLGKKGMIYLSTWPDEIKSDTIYPTSFTCHYQDLNGGMTDSAVVASLTYYPTEGGDLFMALDSIEVVLQRKPTNHDALVFYVHFMADRFCPMHVAHLDDKGGNAVKMRWFGQNTNLHSVWDSKLIENKGFSYTEYANYLHNVYSKQRKTIQKMTDKETLLYTYHLTDSIYQYHPTWSGNAYHYAYRWTEAAEYQMYMAGIKLAQSLNALF
ncbi:MAG: S1/P1 nuclease [Paludibacteraceae bacterium]|nr:S1/P1 nuclease [Paludibacteraceae bacterium]